MTSCCCLSLLPPPPAHRGEHPVCPARPCHAMAASPCKVLHGRRCKRPPTVPVFPSLPVKGCIHTGGCRASGCTTGCVRVCLPTLSFSSSAVVGSSSEHFSATRSSDSHSWVWSFLGRTCTNWGTSKGSFRQCWGSIEKMESGLVLQIHMAAVQTPNSRLHSTNVFLYYRQKFRWVLQGPLRGADYLLQFLHPIVSWRQNLA